MADSSQESIHDTTRSNLRLHVLAIVILAGVVIYLFDSATDEEILDFSRIRDLTAQEYDYFMANVDSIHYTPQGRADYRFRADRVTHYPDPEFSIIEAPRFVIYSADESAWRINAVTGRVQMDRARNQESLLLNENVMIDGITANGKPVKITTDSLTLWPKDRNLSTNSLVTLESDGFVTTSVGLFADLNTNVIRQLASGQMQYEKTQAPTQAP